MTERSVNEILLNISEFDFEYKFMICSSDEATVYYTAGFVLCSDISVHRAWKCFLIIMKVSLSKPKNPVNQKNGSSSPCVTEGLSNLQIWYLCLVFTRGVFNLIWNDVKLLNLPMNSCDPRAVFVQVYLQEFSLSSCTEKLMLEKSESGCDFKDKLQYSNSNF